MSPILFSPKRLPDYALGEPIPRDLLLASSGNADAFIAADALARLNELGLIEPAPDGALRLHRLVAAFARRVSADPGASGDVARAIRERADYLIDYGTTEQMRAILGHMRFIVDEQLARVELADSSAEHADPPEQASGSAPQAAGLCSALGMLLIRLAAYDQAHPYLQRAVALSRWAGSVAATAERLVQLAILHQYRHEPDDALRCYAEALALANAALPADDPLLASCAAHLGYALSLRGAFDEAGPLLEQGLAIAERMHGPHHPETASYLNLFGYHLVLLGDAAAARSLLERALAIREAAVGLHRPLTVQSLNNLAEALHAAGDLPAARAYHEQALAGRLDLFGERHHGVAESYRNFAILALDEGDVAEARRLANQAVMICEETVGPVHRDTALAYQALAEIELALGRREAAIERYRQALTILDSFYLPGTTPLLRLHARVAHVVDTIRETV